MIFVVGQIISIFVKDGGLSILRTLPYAGLLSRRDTIGVSFDDSLSLVLSPGNF